MVCGSWTLFGGGLKRLDCPHAIGQCGGYQPGREGIASVGNDGKVKLWEAETKKELRILEESKGQQLISVGFIAGGKQLFAGSGPNLARVWEAETGAEVFKLAHERAASSLPLRAPTENYSLPRARMARFCYGTLAVVRKKERSRPIRRE